MATIIIGSARIDENGNIAGGSVGDQKQISLTNDMSGEVSMQSFYVHSKGWYILRPKSVAHANAMALLMKKACNNKNLGYDQYNRLGVVKYGINTTVKTECDCSSLVRECIKEATGKDVGDFYTGNEASVLEKSGLFYARIAFVSLSKTPIYDGDVLVTKTIGHTVIAVSGNARNSNTSSSTTSSPTTILKIGSTGSEVKELQTNLNKLGYDCGTVDGEFGSKTDAAVRAFQKDKGLVVDGQVGKNTKAKIKECLKALTATSSSGQGFKSYYVGTGKKGMLVTTNLNYRTKPVNGTVKGTLTKGKYVFPTERTAGGAFPSYWFKVNGYWCSGKYLQGWVLDKTANKWWYNDQGSYPKSEWLKIDNVWYYFKSDGYMAADAYVKANGKNLWYYVDKNGAWQTSKDVAVKPGNVVK